MANGTVRVYAGLLDAMTDDEVRFVSAAKSATSSWATSRKPAGGLHCLACGLVAASGNQAVAQLSALGDWRFAEALVNAQFSQSQEKRSRHPIP